MVQRLSNPVRHSNLWDFIRGERRNTRYAIVAISGMILQFILFKYLYPYADFFSDSYSYISAAAINSSVNIWPVGYSWFLSLFHFFTSSDTAVVAFQYLLIEAAAFYFFFTFLYFYQPGKGVGSALFVFLFFNPLFLYLSNYISSDALFLGLSVWWFTQLLWLVHRPNTFRLFLQALLLTIAFTVRYNALYYPLIALLALWLSGYRSWLNIAGVLLPLLLIFVFINFTRNKTYEITGHRQFSVFSGWQLANNALYMYPHIKVDSTEIPPGCRQLEQVTNNYFNTVDPQLRDKYPVDGAFYMQYPLSPLKQYLAVYKPEENTVNGFKAWGTVSPVFAAYGAHLIKAHPLAYARYYLLNNATAYFFPPLEYLQVYNQGKTVVGPAAQQWFQYKSPAVRVVSGKVQGYLLFLFPVFFMLMNIAFVICISWWIAVKGYKQVNRRAVSALVLVTVLLLANFSFSVLASPVVFRYQVFPMIVGFAFTLLLMAQLPRKA